MDLRDNRKDKIMKDKNGIEIKCANCHYQSRNFGQCLAALLRPKCENGSRFEPKRAVIEARIRELQDELYADKYNYESWEEIKEEHQKLEATISDLKRENALLKDGESHIMEVEMSPKFIKSIIRAVNSEFEILKRELRFTDEELNLIRNTFQEQTREDKCGWSAEKKIIAKCDELLKQRKD